MNRVSQNGVIVGAVTDIAATAITGVVLMVYIGYSPSLATVPLEARGQAIVDMIQSQPALYLTSLLLGSLCSILGGYVAARIARQEELLNGALSSFLCVGLGVYELLRPSGSQAPWSHILAFVASPALGALGGYLSKRRRQRSSTQPAG